MNRKLLSRLFSNTNNFSMNLCECKVKLKNEDFFILFNLMSQKKEYKNVIGSRFFPQKVSDVIFYKPIPTLYYSEKYRDDISFCNKIELKYLVNLILYYRSKINVFCDMRDRFEKAIMYSEYLEAEDILAKILDVDGYSFWYIEAKLLLLEITKGSLASGEFCNDLLITDNNNLTKTYAYILRDKVSLDVNQRLFDEKFEEHCNALLDISGCNFLNYIVDYFKYSCYEKEKIDEKLVRNLISATAHLSLVDSYVLVEKIISGIASKEACNKESIWDDYYLEIIEDLAKNIDWIGWNNILVLNGKNEYIVINNEKTEVHNALKLFCEDRIEECSEFCINRLENYSNNLSLMNLLAKCNIATSVNVLAGKIINILRDLYLKNLDDYRFNSLVMECSIYVRFFSFFSFGKGLAVLISQEINPHVTNLKTQYVISLINYRFTPSKLVFFLPEDDRELFIENYCSNLKRLYFCDWQMATYEELNSEVSEKFEMDRISKNIIKLFRCNNDDIIKVYQKVNIESEILQDRIFNSIVIKCLFDAYVNNKDYLQAINIYLEAFFVSKVMVRKIDFKKLNNKLSYAVREAIESNIEYCVYIDITKFGINHNEAISENVISSFKTILKRKALDRPSNIEWPNDLREKRLVAYFWFNICIRETIGRLIPPFYIQQDIDDERLKIIEKLIHNYKEIGDERDLLYLEDERRKIGKEKDLASINNCLNRGKININAINYKNETNDALVLAVDRGVNYRAISAENSINEELFGEFIDTFAIVKKNYALEIDKMFSVNIRHGILENEIVRFFKKRRLSSKPYDKSSAKKELESFYTKIYNFIDWLNKEYIWVSYKKVPKGISLYFEEEELREKIYELIQVKTPDDLKNVCTHILDEKLEDELVRLGTIVFEKLYTGIDKLLSEEIINKQSIYTNQAMQCKETLEYELCKIKDWFSFTQNYAENYKFCAWIEQLEEDYPYININSNVPSTFMLSASRLSDMDILFHNLLLNIFKHSGYEEDDSQLHVVAKIDYRKEEEGHIIEFYLKNNVSFIREEEEIIADIKAITMEMSQKTKEPSRLGEQKSGYKKIIRLLNRNYSNKWSLEPQYNSVKKEFSVRLAIEYEEKDENNK